jgi:phosphoserine phosphatase
VAQLDHDAVEMFSDLILRKSFPAAVRRVREHRALGHRTVLITGALDLAIGPLRPLFDDIVAPSLAQRPDGTYRGELTDVPPTGEARASALFEYAAANGFDVAEGVAYADSTSDLPMLGRSGSPSPSTPRRAWPRWRASAAGSWSTSTRRRARRSRSCRSVPSGAVLAVAASARSTPWSAPDDPRRDL